MSLNVGSINSSGQYLHIGFKSNKVVKDFNIRILLNGIKHKDEYTYKHSLAVSHYAGELAKAYATSSNVKDGFVTDVELAAKLHDIGKIDFPQRLFERNSNAKPYVNNESNNNLTLEEKKSIRNHSEVGADIVESFPEIAHLAPYIRHHHENFNGGGYPDGLKKDKIPVESRIIRIVDIFDSRTHDRPDWQTLDYNEAIQKLQELKEEGVIDPELTDLFIKIVPEEFNKVQKNIYDKDPVFLQFSS